MKNKKWYKVTFYAEMNEDDIKAMNGSFFDAMEEAMDIHNCSQLSIEENSSNDNTTDIPCICLHEDDFELSDNAWDLCILKMFPKIDFRPNALVDITFVDEDNMVERYKMVFEDDRFIKCEFVKAIN